MTLSAVIFDLDGVLVSTAELHYQAWKRLADEKGVPFDKDENEKFKGVSRSDCVQMLFPAIKDETELNRLADTKNSCYKELIETLMPDALFPGARRLIDELKEKNIKTAIASVSKNTKRVLEKLQISDLCDTVVDGYDIKNSKPAPDIFLLCAERLNVKPLECVVIEDAYAGVEAAKRAGMSAVGIGKPKDLANADDVVPSVEFLTIESLQKMVK
ncbi:MAG: beta-phosphoglucomutase [Sedimentisphaerales bacterium]|nr:beta-phosphoglucomutase [Sedimentisphaerales bacterium]